VVQLLSSSRKIVGGSSDGGSNHRPRVEGPGIVGVETGRAVGTAPPELIASGLPNLQPASALIIRTSFSVHHRSPDEVLLSRPRIWLTVRKPPDRNYSYSRSRLVDVPQRFPGGAY